MRAELHFPVMGTEAHLIAIGASSGILELAAAELRRLERLWSRFDADSEICQLRQRAGGAVNVSAETAALVAAAIDAWAMTNGRFDPTIITALEQCGYDRTFEQISPTPDDSVPAPARAPGCENVIVDLDLYTVRLPVGVGLDVGGIAKGHAADLVVQQVLDAGADGACVNIGGDLRVAGTSGGDDGWVVAVEHPAIGEVIRVALDEGAVATTSTRKRSWNQADTRRHHLIDPCTGQPAANGPFGVTVVARSATLAEAWSKAFLLERPFDGPLPSGVSAVLVLEDDEQCWYTASGATVAA